MSIADLSIKRPVMITMIMAALLLFGIMSFSKLPLDLMPSVDLPYVTVQTVYAGATPQQIEELITKKIEDEIVSLSLLDSVKSYSMDSVSMIIIGFDLEKNSDVANQEVKDKIDGILSTLPANANTPVISKVDVTATPIMNLILSTNNDATELYDIAEKSIKDQISQINGVGRVELVGGVEKVINVGFESKTIYENSLNLAQISGIISAYNLDMPGGNYQQNGEDLSVRLVGEIHDTSTLSETLIPTATGLRKLGQLAEIEESTEDIRTKIVYYNRNEGEKKENHVLISIIKTPEGNPVNIAKQIKKLIPKLKKSLPNGVDLNITSDSSIEIEGTVNDTMSNIILGIILTALILMLFLHDLRSTMIVAIAMPMSIIPSFIVLSYMGITLNMMSMMGISAAVGVLTMNSVVVLENIFRHKNLGHPSREASSKGTNEVAIAVIASTLTNVCVFVPIGTMGGIVGEFLAPFAITVVVTTLFSLLISFTVTPLLASTLLPDTPRKKMMISKKIEEFFKTLEKGYSIILKKILYSRSRSLLVILGTVILFVFMMMQFPKIPFEFTPVTDTGIINLFAEMPQGTDLNTTSSILSQIETQIAELDEVESITTTLGKSSSTDIGTNLATMEIILIDKDLRNNNHTAIASIIGQKVSNISNAQIRVIASGGMTSGSAPVEFYLQSSDSELLSISAPLLQQALNNVPGLTGVNISAKSGKPEITLTPDQKSLADMGITVQDVALSMRAAIDGIVTTSIKMDGNEYDIRVTLLDRDLGSVEDIGQIPVTTPHGVYPISFFTDIDIQEGINLSFRENRKPTISFTAGLLPGYVLGQVSKPIEAALNTLPDNSKLAIEWAGDTEMMNDTMSRMGIAFIIAIVLTYMLLAAILGKFSQPLIILATIPLSMIGVVAIFLSTGSSMNMVSILAIIMLVGLVVNNGILILEYTNQLRDSGMDVRSALLEACPTKLQSILMANLATILGMAPMALGLGKSGAEMRKPMGLVSIGGLVAATLLTLFVIPAIENAVESRKGKGI